MIPYLTTHVYGTLKCLSIIFNKFVMTNFCPEMTISIYTFPNIWISQTNHPFLDVYSDVYSDVNTLDAQCIDYFQVFLPVHYCHYLPHRKDEDTLIVVNNSSFEMLDSVRSSNSLWFEKQGSPVEQNAVYVNA